jgi:TonB family protein
MNVMRFLLRQKTAIPKTRRCSIRMRSRYYAITATSLFQIMVAVFAVRVWTDCPEMTTTAAPDVFSMAVRTLPQQSTQTVPSAEIQQQEAVDIPVPDPPVLAQEALHEPLPLPEPDPPVQEYSETTPAAPPRAEDAAPPSQHPVPVASDPADEAEHADLLLAVLIQEIEKHKSYPRAARRARLQGVVTIRVSIDRAARIAGFDLVHSSGYRVLDRATEDILHKISGMRLSQVNLDRPLDIVVPIRFELI